MAKKKLDKVVTVKFTVPSFRSKGVEYKSAEVEAQAEAGDVEAQELIKMLLEKGSGVIEMVEVDAEELAAQAKAEAQAKADAEAKAAEAAAKAEAKAAAKAAEAQAKADAKAEAAKAGKGKSETKPKE